MAGTGGQHKPVCHTGAGPLEGPGDPEQPERAAGVEGPADQGLYSRGLSAADIRQLFRFIDWIMELPVLLDDLFWHEIHRYEEETHMPFLTTPERLGLEKGLLAGIEACLKVKFGAEGSKLMPEIRALRNHEMLQTVLDAIGTAASPEDLRRVWAHEGQS